MEVGFVAFHPRVSISIVWSLHPEGTLLWYGKCSFLWKKKQIKIGKEESFDSNM